MRRRLRAGRQAPGRDQVAEGGRRTETGEWVKGLVEKYRDAITAKSADGNKVATAIKYLNEQMRLFNQKGEAMAKDFSADFDGYVAKAWSIGDTSVLPARVVVRKDAETATIYMAYVNMDTASGSYDIGVTTRTAEHVIQEIPASKVR